MNGWLYAALSKLRGLAVMRELIAAVKNQVADFLVGFEGG